MRRQRAVPGRSRALITLAFAAAAALVLPVLIGTPAQADEIVHDGTAGLVFEPGVESGTATVTGYSGSDTEVVIPSTVSINGETLAVTVIGPSAFDAYSTSSPALTGVDIPDSVVAIGESAFMSNAFSTIAIPDSVESIGDFAFLGTPLREVLLGTGLRSLGESSFEHYDYDQDVLLPLAVTFTGAPPTIVAGSRTTVSGSFSEAEQVTISYPAAYDSSVYAGGYTRPTWEGYETESHVNVTFVLGYDGALPIPAARVAEGSTLALPDEPERDGFDFTGWYTDAALSASFVDTEPVTSDTTLYAGWYDPDPTVHAIVDGIFYYVDPTDPDAFAFAGGVWDAPIRDVVIRSSVEIEGQTYVVGGVGRFAFQDAGLRSVSLPDTITVIEEGAFQTSNLSWGNRLGDLVIPDSVVTIGEGAFWGTRLTSLTLGSGLRTIEPQAFVDSELPELTLPDGLETIGGYAFFGGAFPTLTIPASVTSIGENAFREGALESVVLPAGLQYLGWGAFRDNALRSVTIPDTLTTIEVETFAGNPLTQVQIGSSVTSIAGYAFAVDTGSSSRTVSTFAAAVAPTASVTDGVTLTVTFTGLPPTTITPAGPSGSFGPADGVLVLFPLALDAATTAGGFTRPNWNGYASAATVAITFDTNGHGSALAPRNAIVDEPLGTLPAPTALGWNFRGWYLESAAVTPVDASTIATADTTLFAGWSAVPTPEPPVTPDSGAPTGTDVAAAPVPSGLASSGGQADASLLFAAMFLLALGAILVVARRRGSGRVTA